MEDIQEDESIILNKLNNLQKKVIDFLNVKLKMKMTGEEIKIDLNNKNIGNIELNLLSCIEFKNLEVMNLSHNNISDIESLKDFYFPKLKKLDLSSNKIKKNQKNDNNKPNQDQFQKRLFNNYVNLLNNEINLDNNNLIAKDIEEIRMQIKKNYQLQNNDQIDSKSFFRKNLDKPNNDNRKEFIKKLLNKIEKLEKKVIKFVNVKLNMNITKDEIKIDLNNKNIGMNLSHNNISDIEYLKGFQAPKLKKLDLSFNKINNISPLKELSKANNKIEIINLNNNLIENVEIIKSNIFPFIKEINLDNNNLIQKDIDEIKELIINKNNNIHNDSQNYNDFENDNNNDIQNYNDFDDVSFNIFLNENKAINLKRKNLGDEGFKSLIKNLNSKESTDLYNAMNDKVLDKKELEKIKLEDLEILELGINNISNIDVLENLNFKELKSLDLYNNKISDIKVLEKVKLEKLEKLNLSENNISNIDVLENMNFKKLKELYLFRNKISVIKVLKTKKLEI